MPMERIAALSCAPPVAAAASAHVPEARRAQIALSHSGKSDGVERRHGRTTTKMRQIDEVLTAQLRSLGVDRGDVLLVHTSYRAVRPVEGGPGGLIEALRSAVGDTGTIVMPSWGNNDDAPFNPATSVDPSLGVTADVFRRLPGVRRSNHPFAFAALGPHAETITSDPIPLPQ